MLFQFDETMIDNILLSKVGATGQDIRVVVVDELTRNKEYFDGLFSRIQAKYSRTLTPAIKVALVYCHYLHGSSIGEHYLPDDLLICYVNHRVGDVNTSDMLGYYIRHK